MSGSRSQLALVAAGLGLFFACISNNNQETGEIVGGGDLEYGEECTGIGQCGEGMVCAGDAVCRWIGEPGTLDVSQECVSTEYCALGLACSSLGVCATMGSNGTAAQGDSCAVASDCQLGLDCVGETCVGLQVPFWTGVECEETNTDVGDFRVYFEVPGDDASPEFYRLPFPNDARVREDGTLDLSGHPQPGALIDQLGDVVGEMFGTIESEFDGFGPNQGVLFRFTHRIDFSTVDIGLPGDGTIAVIDITPGSDEYGERLSSAWQGFTGRRNYICHNWLMIHPSDGRPWTPGHTYAAVLTTGVRKRDSNLGAIRDDDFDAMLSSTEPSDARLVHAWNAYQPLRDFLADGAEWPSSALAAAAVFTVGDPTEYPVKLRESVRDSADLSTVSGVVSCETDTDTYASADDERRGCSTRAGFTELQGLVSLPHYQEGTPPYKNAEDGGAIDFSVGTLLPVEYRDVNFALTIPKNATMPTTGWPLVIYGHGTGGMYRSAALGGAADSLSAVTLDDGTVVNFATLSIDQVMHGPRRAPQNWDDEWLTLDPNAYDADVLYFNPVNPAAARDNAMQSAADYFALVRMVTQATSWPALDTALGGTVAFDPDQIYYLGHSQGAVAGLVFAPYEPDVQGMVFSGGGGLLIESLLNKTKPFNVPAAINVGLADPLLDRYHPVLNIVQMMSERADGVNHARHVFWDPKEGIERRDVLQTFGIGDSYSPDATQYALARALRVEEVIGENVAPAAYKENDGEGLRFVPPEGQLLVEPVAGNRLSTTAVVRLYQGVGSSDPHFVIFDREDAERQYSHFLATAVRDGQATLVQRVAP